MDSAKEKEKGENQVGSEAMELLSEGDQPTGKAEEKSDAWHHRHLDVTSPGDAGGKSESGRNKGGRQRTKVRKWFANRCTASAYPVW